MSSSSSIYLPYINISTRKHSITGTGRTPEEQAFIELVPIVQYYSDLKYKQTQTLSAVKQRLISLRHISSIAVKLPAKLSPCRSEQNIRRTETAESSLARGCSCSGSETVACRSDSRSRPCIPAQASANGSINQSIRIFIVA